MLGVEELVAEALHRIQDNQMSICHNQGMSWEPERVTEELLSALQVVMTLIKSAGQVSSSITRQNIIL